MNIKQLKQLSINQDLGIRYKLVTQCYHSRLLQSGQTHWKVGETVIPTGAYVGQPCGPGVLHAYHSPIGACLYNHLHAKIHDPRLLEIQGNDWTTDGLKSWTQDPVKVLKELPLPRPSRRQKIAWGLILTANPFTRQWALDWLSNKDRTKETAQNISKQYEKDAPNTRRSSSVLYVIDSAWRLRPKSNRWKSDLTFLRNLPEVIKAAWHDTTSHKDRHKLAVRHMAAWFRAGKILEGRFPVERFDEEFPTTF